MQFFTYSLIVSINFYFQVRPHLELTFENILSHINTVYVLRTKKGIMKFEGSEEYSYLRLKVTKIIIMFQYLCLYVELEFFYNILKSVKRIFFFFFIEKC